jgi:hypothetical protein
LADRLRFLIANPAVREAAGQAAKCRIREHYQWTAVAGEIEGVYFEMMGWERTAAHPKKPSGLMLERLPGAQQKAG